MTTTYPVTIAQHAISEQPKFYSFLNANVIRRAGFMALILGTALTLANQSGAVFGDEAVQILPLVLVYATPFIVVAFSQMLGARRAHIDARGAHALPRENSVTTALSHAIPLRSVAMGLIVGSVNTSIVVFAALMDGAGLANLPVALIGQAFVLPMLFGLLSQTISYRRAARRIAERLQGTAP